MAVRDGQHLNDGGKLSINQRKWKSPQKELSRAVNPSWPTLRSLSNAGDRAAHFTRKSGSRARASLPIPVKSSLELLTRCFVELNFLVCHEGAWRRFARELLPRKPSLPCQSPDPQVLPRTGSAPSALSRWLVRSWPQYTAAVGQQHHPLLRAQWVRRVAAPRSDETSRVAHPCDFASCTSAPSRCFCGMNGGAAFG